MPSLDGKIGPVPKKPLVLVLALVVGFLVYRHFKNTQTTSAGSNATPPPSATLPPTPQDTTGGGASGSSTGSDDVFGPLFGQLFSLASGDQAIAQTLASNPQGSTTNSTYYYYPSSGQPDTGGGNTSTPTTATIATDTTPVTTFPWQAPIDPNIVRAAEEGAKAFSGAGGPVVLGGTTSTGPLSPVDPNGPIQTVTYSPGAPFASAKVSTPSSANYSGTTKLTPKQVAARNKRQAL